MDQNSKALKEALSFRASLLGTVKIQEQPREKAQQDEARGQLQDDVNQLYEKLAELQIELDSITNNSSGAPDTADPLSSIYKAKESRLEAEATFMKETAQSLPDIPTNSVILAEKLKEHMKKNYQQLRDTREFVQIQGRALQLEEESEKQLNEELTRMHSALQGKITEAADARENNGESMDTDQKKTKILAYYKKTMKQMALFINKHFPQPSDEIIQNWARKQKDSNRRRNTNDNNRFASLQTILERLMNSGIENPSDAYITLDDTHWPPYIEMLLRYGIALKHRTDCNKIKLTPFHL